MMFPSNSSTAGAHAMGGCGGLTAQPVMVSRASKRVRQRIALFLGSSLKDVQGRKPAALETRCGRQAYRRGAMALISSSAKVRAKVAAVMELSVRTS